MLATLHEVGGQVSVHGVEVDNTVYTKPGRSPPPLGRVREATPQKPMTGSYDKNPGRPAPPSPDLTMWLAKKPNVSLKSGWSRLAAGEPTASRGRPV